MHAVQAALRAKSRILDLPPSKSSYSKNHEGVLVVNAKSIDETMKRPIFLKI